MDMRYKIDISSSLCGRTIEVEAHSAMVAYERGIKELNVDKFEKITQIRNEIDRVVYSEYEQYGLNPILNEE